MKEQTENLEELTLPGGSVRIDGEKLRPLGDGEASEIDRWVYGFCGKRVYDHNAGAITYIDNEGRVYLAAQTRENIRALQKAGYEHDSVCVPISAGESFENGETQDKFIEIMERGRITNGRRGEKTPEDVRAEYGKNLEAMDRGALLMFRTGSCPIN